MAEYNVDEYTVEGEDTQYNFKISLVDNKINLQLTEISETKLGKNYEGEFTLEELRQINRVFHLTNTIYEAQDEFKKAVEKQKIALSENEAYVNIMFHMVLGTDNSPFVIALPRNEGARIMKLEQDNDMLKLERDNLFNKLEILKRNTNEILQNTNELENENNKLIDMVEKVEEEMDLSVPIKPINPSQSLNIAPPLPQQNQNINTNNSINMNKFLKNQKIENNPPSSSQKNPSNIQPKPVQKKPQFKKLKNGIISNIIKNEGELALVTQRIQSNLNKNIFYNNLFFSKIDGDKASTFHQKCDKAKRTLTLIMDNDGNRFGGFTMRSWTGTNIQKKDEKAFIFSVDKNKIYPVLPDEVAIGCYPNFGPIFFGCQIRVYDNFFKKGGSTYLKGLNFATDEDYELTNGKQMYGIKELEVYEVNSL
jgi:hypothetical protein